MNFTSTTLTILLIFTYTIVISQASLGVTSGFNNSSVKLIDQRGTGFNSLQSWFVGINSTLVSKKKWEIRSELQFSNKGWSVVGNEEDYQYLDILTMLEFKPLPVIGIYTGFNLGYLINESSAASNKNIDSGILLGASVHVERLNFYAHYNRSLVRHNILSENIFWPNYSGYNANYQVGVTYKIFNKSNTTKSFFGKPFEIGISTVNLSSFRVLYKQKLDNERYARFGLLASDIRYFNLINGKKTLNYSIGLNIGLETRIDFDKFTFIRGPHAQLKINNFSSNASIIPSIGYIVGLQYNFSSQFSLGVELIPSISVPIMDSNFGNSNYNIELDIDNIPTFFLVYHFKR